jgi:hypothetical protein
MHTTRAFKNGNSQAVRIPAERDEIGNSNPESQIVWREKTGRLVFSTCKEFQWPIIPVFTDEQRALVISECERLGWVHVMDDGTPAHLDGWVLLGEGEWVTDGWTWDVMDEICDYCGYLVDPSVTCDCGAIS